MERIFSSMYKKWIRFLKEKSHYIQYVLRISICNFKLPSVGYYIRNKTFDYVGVTDKHLIAYLTIFHSTLYDEFNNWSNGKIEEIAETLRKPKRSVFETVIYEENEEPWYVTHAKGYNRKNRRRRYHG